MNRPIFRPFKSVGIIALSLLAFAILTVRFSPNWAAFYFGLREAKVDASHPDHNAAVEKAILSGYSVRGLFVVRQAHDLNTVIEEPNHKIVRWRLLFPVLGHFLKLPDWLTLGLAQIGCLALVAALVALGFAQGLAGWRSGLEIFCLALIAGSSAPFFTSMGWLGYYDSWLALALLGVAFAPGRAVLLSACVLAPWIDERFALGLPLALVVRRLGSDSADGSLWAWFKNQALLPVLLVLAYAAVRLSLGGSSGSQSVGDYLNQFVFSTKLSIAQRLFGAWSGLRAGWVLVAIAIFGRRAAAQAPSPVILALGVTATALISLVTALDLGRSMVLLLPVVPLGWMYALRSAWWPKLWLAPVLALAALAPPARQVFGETALPVDNFWTPSAPLLTALNNLGVMYASGDGVPSNRGEAVKWFRRGAQLGYATAEKNLGVILALSANPNEQIEAAEWYRKAAEQGNAEAQNNLGSLYATGRGVEKDSAAALRYFLLAANRGYAIAQNNLGIMYSTGDGVARNDREAVKWFRKAAEQGNSGAQRKLAVMYANGTGVPKDLVQAYVWLSRSGASSRQPDTAGLKILEQAMTADQLTAAKKSAP